MGRCSLEALPESSRAAAGLQGGGGFFQPRSSLVVVILHQTCASLARDWGLDQADQNNWSRARLAGVWPALDARGWAGWRLVLRVGWLTLQPYVVCLVFPPPAAARGSLPGGRRRPLWDLSLIHI